VQRPLLQLSEAPRLVRGQARLVGEREVDQHDQPEPVRHRLENLGHGGRHQPVEQHGRAVRQAFQGAGERVPRGCRWAWPGCGDRDLVHVPGSGEAVAECAVVPVSAAGCPGIIDTAGQDDVDGRHRDRS
jgi:hypothetical protein